MKIRTKYALLTASLVVAVVASIAAAVTRVQRQALERQSAERLEALMEGVTRIAQEAIAGKDDLMLIGYLMFLERTHPELAYAGVTRRDHTAAIGTQKQGLAYLTRTVSAKNLPVTYTIKAPRTPEGQAPGTVEVTSQGVSLKISGDATVKVSEPRARDTLHIRLGFVTEKLEAEINRALKPLIRRTLALAGFFLGFGVLSSMLLTTWITGPLTNLAAAVAAIGRGQFDVMVPAKGKDEVGALALRFNEMTGKLKELMEFKEDILHTLTHEMNTPLGGLKGYLELWEDRKLPPGDQQEVIQTMMAAVLRMEQSLGGALELFKAPAASKALGPATTMQFHEIIKQVVYLFLPVMASKKITLYNMAMMVRVELKAQEELLRQVVNNLVSNALKYTPERGEVILGLKDQGESVLFWVSNTGEGITPEDLPHIFTKFYRAKTGRAYTERIPGSGLGLSIAKQAVEALGGKIWAESVVGAGVAFYVSLPKFPKVPSEAIP